MTRGPSGCPAGCRLHVPWSLMNNSLFVIYLHKWHCTERPMPIMLRSQPHLPPPQPPTSLFIHALPTHPPISSSIHPSICQLTHTPIHPPTHPSTHSSTHLSNLSSIYPSIHLCSDLPIHLLPSNHLPTHPLSIYQPMRLSTQSGNRHLMTTY